jgi:hypothetical protein
MIYGVPSSSLMCKSSASDDISIIVVLRAACSIKVYTSVILTSDIRDVDIRGSLHTPFLHISVIIVSPEHLPPRRNKYSLGGKPPCQMMIPHKNGPRTYGRLRDTRTMALLRHLPYTLG